MLRPNVKQHFDLLSDSNLNSGQEAATQQSVEGGTCQQHQSAVASIMWIAVVIVDTDLIHHQPVHFNDLPQ